MDKFCIGLDIGKTTFFAAIEIPSETKVKVKKLSNDQIGFEKFTALLEDFSPESVHCCMESTGKYGNKLALFLHEKGYTVSIVNPAKIKFFMKSQLTRNKTDSIDAKQIRTYCELLSPPAWIPESEEVQALQNLVKRVDVLTNTLLQEKNRLENSDDLTRPSIDDHILYLEAQIEKLQSMINDHIQCNEKLNTNASLLQSIPGIGSKTIHNVLAFFSDISRFDNAKQMAAYVGLNPNHFQSGSSLNHSRLSKTGNSRLRKMLYMPALVAIRYQPTCKAFYEKLLSKGKAKKVAICAVMRKLIHIIYGVLKSQTMFDEKLM